MFFFSSFNFTTALFGLLHTASRENAKQTKKLNDDYELNAFLSDCINEKCFIAVSWCSDGGEKMQAGFVRYWIISYFVFECQDRESLLLYKRRWFLCFLGASDINGWKENDDKNCQIDIYLYVRSCSLQSQTHSTILAVKTAVNSFQK